MAWSHGGPQTGSGPARRREELPAGVPASYTIAALFDASRANWLPWAKPQFTEPELLGLGNLQHFTAVARPHRELPGSGRLVKVAPCLPVAGLGPTPRP